MHAYVCMLWLTHDWKALQKCLVPPLQHIHVGEPQLGVNGQVLSSVHVAQMAEHAWCSLRGKFAIENNGCVASLQTGAKYEMLCIIRAGDVHSSLDVPS